MATGNMGKLNVETATITATASMALFRLTTDSAYARKAIEAADYIMRCQQQKAMFRLIPLAGFFCRDSERRALLTYEHHTKVANPVAPLIELCETFPHHPNWMNWYASIRLYTEYFKKTGAITYPYHVLPASVYNRNASQKPNYKEQVENGIPLDSIHYLRIFPVWYGLWGNLGVMLSQAVGLAAAGEFLDDSAARSLARHQFEWTVGRNPFDQSLMYGEGHNYAPQYTVLSGDMVGSLPVGVQTSGNKDVPYWSASNCYNYKEVWVHPSSRWLELMDKLEGPGNQTMDSPISEVSYELLGTGKVRIRAKTGYKTGTNIRFWNLRLIRPGKKRVFPGGTQTTWEADITSADGAWMATVTPEGSATGLKTVFNLPWTSSNLRHSPTPARTK